SFTPSVLLENCAGRSMPLRSMRSPSCRSRAMIGPLLITPARFSRGDGLGRLPLDGASDRGHLPSGSLAGVGKLAHGLDQLTPRTCGERCGATFIEASAVPQFQVLVVAEEVRRAHGAIGAGHRLARIVKIG